MVQRVEFCILLNLVKIPKIRQLDVFTGIQGNLCIVLHDIYISHNKLIRKLDEELYNLWVIKSRIMNRVGHIMHMKEMRNAHKILVRKPEGKNKIT
jgi:hypothetical protein